MTHTSTCKHRNEPANACVCVSCFFSLDVALTCWNERIRLLTASRQRVKTLRASVCGWMRLHNTHITDMSSGPGSPVPWCHDTSGWVGVMLTKSRHWVFPLDSSDSHSPLLMRVCFSVPPRGSSMAPKGMYLWGPPLGEGVRQFCHCFRVTTLPPWHSPCFRQLQIKRVVTWSSVHDRLLDLYGFVSFSPCRWGHLAKSGSVEISRLYWCSIKAIWRLYWGDCKALLRLY